MTRAQSIATINAQLASLDDERLQAVADLVEEFAAEHGAAEPFVMRELTPRERALIEQSKEDFKAGRTMSIDEARARTDAFLAERRAARAKS